ncbi:MAG: MerR family transcriptional regulator [Gammaproteobacteria bacterium]|nr:MerR family transcriptional regulator [Gammaproteobacteria bacterium]
MDESFITKIHDETPHLYIGKAAELSGASRKAIRHYESLGLIPKPQRKGLYRIYSERDVFLIHMIKTAQSVGFSLAELKELVALKVSEKEFPLEFANILFGKKREKLQQEIDTINSQISDLDELNKEMNRIFSSYYKNT